MESTVTRTRRSIATQLREALDDFVQRGAINGWRYGSSIKPGYWIVTDGGETYMDTGKCMDWLNTHGYDVRFGKA